MLAVALIILVSLSLSRVSDKIGLPTLAVFIGLGMLFGEDGLLKIQFSNYALSEQICSIALILIMFYGGFGTNWNGAKPTAKISVLLSSAGVVLTALLTTCFALKSSPFKISSLFFPLISWIAAMIISGRYLRSRSYLCSRSTSMRIMKRSNWCWEITRKRMSLSSYLIRKWN